MLDHYLNTIFFLSIVPCILHTLHCSDIHTHTLYKCWWAGWRLAEDLQVIYECNSVALVNMLYKQPALLNCCTYHFLKDTCRSQVLGIQQELCKAPRKWRRRGGADEAKALKKTKLISPKLQNWSSATEEGHWLGKPGFCNPQYP